jgi:acyl carrier protein
VVAEVLATLRPITGEAVPASRLETDLGMDSVELAAFAAALCDRFGDQVDLLEHLAGLELDELIELTVGQVAGFVAGRLPATTGAGSG